MTTAKEMTCRICKKPGNTQAFQVREMMFGSREVFTYFECQQCGCFQLSDIPKQMAEYYPPDYLVHRSPDQNGPYGVRARCLKRLRLNRDAYAFLGTGLVGRLLSMAYPNPALNAMSLIEMTPDSRVLDVGCASGALLYSLRALGFRNLTGVDPYAPTEFVDKDIRIMRKTIHELPDGERFDVILSMHSLEHVPDQLETLSKASRLLADDGVCLVRMPVKTETVWRRYGVNWVQIDAPRHIFIHTPSSFRRLAEQAGLEIKKTVFDSDAFLFWGSELYQRDIPLVARQGVNPLQSLLLVLTTWKFRKKAAQLNRANQGDQAAFYLVRL